MTITFILYPTILQSYPNFFFDSWLLQLENHFVSFDRLQVSYYKFHFVVFYVSQNLNTVLNNRDTRGVHGLLLQNGF